MNLMEYNIMISLLQKPGARAVKYSLIPALVLLLNDIKDILFVDGRYKKLKWYQFKRLMSLAGKVLKFIFTLIAIVK